MMRALPLFTILSFACSVAEPTPTEHAALAPAPEPTAHVAAAGGTAAAAPAACGDHGDCACGSAGGAQHFARADGTAAPIPDGARLFGAPPAANVPVTALSEILGAPARFEGQNVHLSGRVAQVCQRMGCWMELRADDGAQVRVPLAGHSFFLPRDVAGRPVSVQGRVIVASLSPEQVAHFRSEGATVTGGAVSVEATSVVVR